MSVRLSVVGVSCACLVCVLVCVRVWIRNVSVCRFKTPPCVPQKRPCPKNVFLLFSRYMPLLAFVLGFNKRCSLRSRCSMEMWCGVLTTWSGIAGIGLGHTHGREHDSTHQSGVGALRLFKRALPRLYYCCWCVLWLGCVCARFVPSCIFKTPVLKVTRVSWNYTRERFESTQGDTPTHTQDTRTPTRTPTCTWSQECSEWEHTC